MKKEPKTLKYIVFQHRGMLTPVIFSRFVSHDIIANCQGLFFGVISAGFCNIRYGKGIEVYVFGRSITLNIDSRPEDTEIIKRLF